MRQYTPATARQYPTDRAPLTVAKGTTVAQAGGGTTTIGTYTVPAGRRARVTWVAGSLLLTIALAAGQFASIVINLTPNGGGLTQAKVCELPATEPITEHANFSGPGPELGAGDVFSVAVTVDVGAGAARAGAFFALVEYDA